MGRAGPGPVDYGFDRAGPGLGLEYMGPGWSGPRVGEPVANTGSETAMLKRGRRRRSLSGLRDGGARKGRRRPSWKRLEDGGAGQSSQTVYSWAGARIWRSWPELGNGGALPWLGDGEVGRGSETAELARARRQRSWKGLEDDGSWSGLGDRRAGQGSETAELPRGSETVELVCGPETTKLTSDQGSETVEMARARRWRNWSEL